MNNRVADNMIQSICCINYEKICIKT